MEWILILIVFGIPMVWAVKKIISNYNNPTSQKENNHSVPAPQSRTVTPAPTPHGNIPLPSSVLLMVQNQTQILKDTIDLINNSNVLKTVVGRIEFLYSILLEFEQNLEPYKDHEFVKGIIASYHTIFDGLSKDEASYINKAIVRAFTSEADIVKKMKTIRGKKERLNRLAFSMIEQAPEEKDFIVQLLNSCLDGINRVTAEEVN